jgi:hypothetical protein
MYRAWVWFALTLSIPATAAPAAPVPPPSEKELIAKHWGKPEGGGTFSLADKRLTIRSHGVPTAFKERVSNDPKVPRVIRTVTGDFEATIRIENITAPNQNPIQGSDYSAVKTGLFVSGGGYDVELLVQVTKPLFKIQPNADVNRSVTVWGGGASSFSTYLTGDEPGLSNSLRVTRKKQVITVAYSVDGEKWSETVVVKPPDGFDFPDEVSVGLFFEHNTHQEAPGATFDKFTVTKPK